MSQAIGQVLHLAGPRHQIAIELVALSESNSGHNFDQGWIDCLINVDLPPFKGSWRSQLLNGELRQIKQELCALLEAGEGALQINNIEQDFNIEVSLRVIGQANCRVEILPHSAVRLMAEFVTDRTYLQAFIEELNQSLSLLNQL